jgi:hypothetical protein
LTLDALGKLRSCHENSLIVQRTAAKPGYRDRGDQLNRAGFLGIWPALLALFAVQPAAVSESVTRLVVQDEVILRVPVLPRTVVPRIEWIERKGPKCIPAAAIRRAVLSGPEEVDFVLTNRRRVRAHFDEDCPALDFYGGFYLRPEDERLCAGRDSIHSRMGGSCTIERFWHLVPKLRD